MPDKIILTIGEIKNTPVDFLTSIKIFAIAMVLIPWSFLAHLFFTIIGMLSIPSSVIDIITVSEKVKILIKKKKNANL